MRRYRQAAGHLVNQALEMPVPYLEAKPMRLVPVGAIARAVAPADISKETVEALKAAGIPVTRLKEGASVDEVAAAQSDPEVLFSRRSKARDPMQESKAKGQQRRYAEGMADTKKHPIDRLFRLPFKILGGMDESGKSKWGVKVDEAIAHAYREAEFNVGPDSKFTWLNTAMETVRAGWLKNHGVPIEATRAHRRKGLHKAQIERQGIAFVQMIERANLTPSDHRSLLDILEGNAELDDARLRSFAGPVREAINQLGQELVDLGFLNKETYQKNLSSYLHRSYAKYESDASPLEKVTRKRIGSKRSTLVGDELKARGDKRRVKGGMSRLLKDVPAAQREKAGAAKDWRVLERNNADGKVTARAFFPKDMALPPKLSGPEWTEPTTGWGILGDQKGSLVLRRDWTKKEREAMGEIRDARYIVLRTFQVLAHDIATGRYHEEIAQNPSWFQKERPEDGVVESASDSLLRTYTGVDWVHVPDTKIGGTTVPKWGALAGGYLKASLWRSENARDRMNDPGWLSFLTRSFKLAKTALSPATHMFNTMSNVVLADLHDIAFPELVDAIHEWATGGPMLQEARDNGVFQSGYASTELDRVHLEPLLKEILKQVDAETKTLNPLDITINLIRKITELATKAYSMEDELFRLASYMKDRARGETVDLAVEASLERFMDYGNMPPWPTFLRKYGVPFMSYTYEVVPNIRHAVLTRPWKIAKLFTLFSMMSTLGYLLSDSDEDEHERLLPERDRGLTWVGIPKVMRLPWRDSNGNPMDLELTRVLPAGGFFNESGAIGLYEWLAIGGPIAIALEGLVGEHGGVHWRGNRQQGNRHDGTEGREDREAHGPRHGAELADTDSGG